MRAQGPANSRLAPSPLQRPAVALVRPPPAPPANPCRGMAAQQTASASATASVTAVDIPAACSTDITAPGDVTATTAAASGIAVAPASAAAAWEGGPPLPALAVRGDGQPFCQQLPDQRHPQQPVTTSKHPRRVQQRQQHLESGQEPQPRQEQQSAGPVAGRRQLLLSGAGALLGGAAATAAGSAPPASAAATAAAAAVAAPTVATAAASGACPPAGVTLLGWQALRDPAINRGLATTVAVRQRYGLEGLLPARVTAPQVEVARAAAAVARAEVAAAAAATSGSGGGASLLPYCSLMALREADQATFYSLVQQDVERYLPLIYTPAVGDACLSWGSLLPRPAGLIISLGDAGRVQRLVDNWALGQPKARIAVITDGERILGLGDLGAHGLGIPVGKAAVYGAAGVDPDWILPVALDVGCNSDIVVNDPLYVGLRQPRERGAPYYQLVDETVAALQARYGPGLLIHWEDVGAAQAFPLLERLEAAGVPTFNDDIQATAAVTLAALLGAERLPGVAPLEQQTFLFFGAGQANLGVARLLCAELESRGMDPAAAAERIWLVDRRGLVSSDRADLSAAKAKFAKRRPPGLSATGGGGGGGGDDLAGLVAALRPTALIGAATVGGAFGTRVLSALIRAQPSPSSRPLVFALSNPTSKAECSFQQAVEATGGRAVFASGTQFPPLRVASGAAGGSRTLVPAQANNCLVFPGLGAGCVASGAGRVTAGMLLAAARAVAGLTSAGDLETECVLPRVGRLGECAVAVAEAVARAAAVDMVVSSSGISGSGGSGGRGADGSCVEPLLLASASAAPPAPSFGAGVGLAAAGGAQAAGCGVGGAGGALAECLAGLRYRPMQ